MAFFQDAIQLVGTTNLEEGSTVVCPPNYELVDCAVDYCEVTSSLGIVVTNHPLTNKPMCTAMNSKASTSNKQIRVNFQTEFLFALALYSQNLV